MKYGDDTSFGGRFVRFIVDKPWIALFVGLAILAAAGPGGRHIKADFTYRVWFNDNDPLLAEFDAFERRFGNDESTMVVVHSPSGVFDLDSASLLVELTEGLWQVPDVIRVDSLANFSWVHADGDDIIVEPLIPDDMELTDALLAERKKVALAHETLPGYLVSRDGKTAVAFATLKPALDGMLDHKTIIESMQALIAKLKRTDHSFHLTGAGPLSYFFQTTSARDLMTLLPAVFGLTILFLAVTFRRVAGVILPLVVVALSVAATMTTAGWLGIPINNLTSIVPQIVLAVGVADAVHILVTYFRALSAGLPRKEAAFHSLRKNLQPTILTTISTVFGFASFATAEVVPIAQMGVLAAIGTVFAWLFTYFVLGASITILPLRARARGQKVSLDVASPRGERWAQRIVGNRHKLIAGFGALTAISLALAATNTVNSDPYSYFPEDSSLNIATKFMEANVGGTLAAELVVDSGEPEAIKSPEWLAKVDEFQQWIENKDTVTSATSIIDILKSMNRSFNADDPDKYAIPETREAVAQLLLLYTMSLPQGMNINDRVALRNDAIRVTSMWNIHDSKRVLAQVDEIMAKAPAFGLDAHITGKSQLWQRMNPAVVRSFVVSVSIALVLMSLLLIVAFRSVPLGLLAMVPNGVPLIVGGGMLAAIGKSLDIGTVIVFSVCLGIAVDDTVHFLSNYNRLRRSGFTPQETIAQVFTRSWGVRTEHPQQGP